MDAHIIQVRDLIEMLQKHDPTAEVMVGGTEQSNLINIKEVKPFSRHEGYRRRVIIEI